MRNKKQNQTLSHSMHHDHRPNIIKTTLKKIPFLFNLSKSIYIFLLHLVSIPRWRLALNNDQVKLNLGSGNTKGKNGWINVDLSGADINYDLRKGIPLDYNKVEDDELVVNYNKKVSGGLGSDAQDLINILMRKVTRRIPYTSR